MVASSDPNLVQAAKGGDSTAFERLLRPEYRTAYRLAYAMLHDTQEAEDAVREAALKAWRKIGKLRGDTALGPWFLGIVANQCRGVACARWTTVLRLADPPTLEKKPQWMGRGSIFGAPSEVSDTASDSYWCFATTSTFPMTALPPP